MRAELTPEARLLASEALAAFERSADPVLPDVAFHEPGEEHAIDFPDATADAWALISKAELVDYARRCLRAALADAAASVLGRNG